MKLNENTKFLAILLACIGCVFYVSSYYVEQQKEQIVDGLTIEILEHEKTLSTIAEITDRNGADTVVESIIIDCSAENRQRFELLLNNLSSLSPNELLEVEDLFDGCARFFSSRKAVMVARMEREYEVYKSLVDLLKILDGTIVNEQYNIEAWGQLVSFEKKRSSIFDQQVRVQYEIIKALQNGERVNSEVITTMLTEAQNITQEATVVNRQIDALRATLHNI